MIRSDVKGTQYTLIAENLGSVNRGAPVYFRGLEVGQVLGHRLSEDASRFEIPIFVRSPHDQLVRNDSQFWDVSGITFRAGADGIDLQIASIASLVAGGVAFSSPRGSDNRAAAEASFSLYPTQASLSEARIDERIPYIIDFDGSIRGLQVGAPVEFRGIRTGSVERIELIPDFTTGKAPIRVYVNLEPQRFANSDAARYDRGAVRADRASGVARAQGAAQDGQSLDRRPLHRDERPARCRSGRDDDDRRGAAHPVGADRSRGADGVGERAARSARIAADRGHRPKPADVGLGHPGAGDEPRGGRWRAESRSGRQ